MLELYIDLGIALELGLVILDPEWSGSGQTGVPRALGEALASKAPVSHHRST